MSVRPSSDAELIGDAAPCGQESGPSPTKSIHGESRKLDYERGLGTLRTISLVTYILSTANLFCVFCALTWATTVLLGSYVQSLFKWDYIEVPILLFLEYLCVGLFAFLRTIGYRLYKWPRRFLFCVQIFLPLSMGGLAVLGYLSESHRERIRQSILHLFRHFTTVSNAATDHFSFAASNAPAIPYGTMRRSLRIFYILIMLSAGVVLSEVIIRAALHCHFLRSASAKSLRNYHDKMLQSRNSWMHPAWEDMDYDFQMQSSDYKHGSSAEDVCKMYADLVWYLYVHEGGFEAAEAALADSDGYVRQAAINIVGFWAVLETLEEMQDNCRLPLRFHIPLLSKLADVADKSYGALGTAAARSIALLLETDPVGTATNVQSESGEGLLTILLKRVTQLLPPHSPNSHLAPILQKEACAYIHALKKLLLRLRQVPAAAHVLQITNARDTSNFTEAQREDMVKEMQKSLLQDDPALSSTTNTSDMDNIIKRLDDQLSDLLAQSDSDDADRYSKSIRDALVVPSAKNRLRYAWIVVSNLLLYVGSFFVGFFLGSLIDHRS